MRNPLSAAAAVTAAALFLAACGGGGGDGGSNTPEPPPPPPPPPPTVPAKAADRKAVDKIYNGIDGLTLPVTVEDQVIMNYVGSLAINLPHDDTNGISIFGGPHITKLSEKDGWVARRFKATEQRGGTAFTGGTFEGEFVFNSGVDKEGQPFSVKLAAGLLTEKGETFLRKTETVLAPGRIGITGQTVGVRSYTDPHARIAGTYMGVKGTYRCTASAPAKKCATRKASESEGYRGFELGEIPVAGGSFTSAMRAPGSTGGEWTFVPDNLSDKVTEGRLSRGSSSALPWRVGYGWWSIDMDDGTYRIGTIKRAIHGTPTSGTGLHALSGTAQYSGTAAGMYALYAGEGRLDDAGRFEADSMLAADFNKREMSGKLHNFKGYDGMARDWTVELKAVRIEDGGDINDAASTKRNNVTAWTVGGKTGEASGSWIAETFRRDGGEGIPDTVTGGFYSKYGRYGKMIGGFGARRDD